MSDTSVKERAREAFVRQQDVPECGVACLAAIVRYHGEEIGVDRLWALSDASAEGTTLQGLREAAEAVGLEAGGYEATLEHLGALESPCILHVTTEEGRDHYVVCYGTVAGQFVIGDPGGGVEERPPALLAKRWPSRVLLTAEPTADFEAQVAAARDGAAGPPVDEEYRCFGVDSTPFGLHQMLVETADAEAPHLVPSGMGQLLLSLDRFDTLGQHAAVRARASARRSGDGEPGGPEAPSAREDRRDQIERRLRRSAADGVLAAKSDVRDDILSRQADAADAPPPISTLGIPTAGRPQSLRRALASYVEDSRGRPGPTKIVVMEDAADPDARDEARAVVADVQAEHEAAELFYADRRRRAEYAETLADRAGVSPEVTRFGLLGTKARADTYGAPRNALLLQTVGERSVQVDDDTVADTGRLPVAEEGLALTSERIPREWWFFENREALRDAAHPTDPGVLDVHETLLGKTVGQCLADVEDEDVRIGDIDAALLEQVRAGARVAVSFAGAMGDSGRLSTRMRVLADASTFGRLTEHYEAHRDTTEVLRAPTRPTITNGAGCVSMNIGIDHSALVPPFMPVGQGEDHVFGLALKLCTRRTCRGYLPHALLHDPQGERDRAEGAPDFGGFGAYGVVQHLMAAAHEWLRDDDGAAALRALGRHLQDVGALSPSAFADYAERRARTALGQDLQSVERLLRRRAQAPTAWTEDVKQYLRSARTAAQEGGLSVPTDLSGAAEERRARLQERVARYGTLLRHWPVLRKAAARLKEKGTRVAEPV
ncbi:MAG: cysteine peptidase family C39 domain-containing protein [Salinivenus sp.]